MSTGNTRLFEQLRAIVEKVIAELYKRHYENLANQWFIDLNSIFDSPKLDAHKVAIAQLLSLIKSIRDTFEDPSKPFHEDLRDLTALLVLPQGAESKRPTIQ